MSQHYEQRMEEDLQEIRNRVGRVADRVENQMQSAMRALLSEDRALANEVILGDRRVNRRIKTLDGLCHAFIVRHSPSAGHLRYVSAVLRLSVALERVGDYASTIGREVVQLSRAPEDTVKRDIELISHQSRKSLHQALTAFQEGDVDLAGITLGTAGQTDSTLRAVFDELLQAGEARETPLKDIFGLLRIINLIKRVAEQAENICEQTIFAVTGDTGDPKVFRILFVDEKNAVASQIAEAYARKAFPESGEYASGGWAPADHIDPGLAEFLDRKGIDAQGLEPKKLSPVHEQPRHYHVIVALSRDVRRHIDDVPFRSVVLDWDIADKTLDGIDEGELEDLYQTVSGNVQDLVKTLRGPDAR